MWEFPFWLSSKASACSSGLIEPDCLLVVIDRNGRLMAPTSRLAEEGKAVELAAGSAGEVKRLAWLAQLPSLRLRAGALMAT